MSGLGNRLVQFWEYVRTLFEEPRENTQELVIFFAILAIILLFGWVFFSLISFARRELREKAKLPPEKKPLPTKERKRARTLIISIFGAAIFVGLISGTFYSSRPSSCSQCHVMNKYFESWKKSSHGNVGCLACHQQPGVAGFLIRNLGQLRYIPWLIRQTAFPGEAGPIRAVVSDDSCNRCHQNILGKVVKNRGLRVSHKEIVSAGYYCTDCHSAMPHKKAAFVTQYSRKDKCLQCHNGQEASGKCSLCHVDDISGISNSLKNYPKIDINLEKFGILKGFR